MGLKPLDVSLETSLGRSRGREINPAFIATNLAQTLLLVSGQKQRAAAVKRL